MIAFVCFRLIILFETVTEQDCFFRVWEQNQLNPNSLVDLYFVVISLLGVLGLVYAYQNWTNGLFVETAVIGLIAGFVLSWGVFLEDLTEHFRFERKQITFEEYQQSWPGRRGELEGHSRIHCDENNPLHSDYKQEPVRKFQPDT